eukprot:jgi/Botrbrau1/6228/Bobra.0109s0023.1
MRILLRSGLEAEVEVLGSRQRQAEQAVKPVAVRLGEQTPNGPPVYVTGKDGRSHDSMARCRGQQVVYLKEGAVVVAVGPVGSAVPRGRVRVCKEAHIGKRK